MQKSFAHKSYQLKEESYPNQRTEVDCCCQLLSLEYLQLVLSKLISFIYVLVIGERNILLYIKLLNLTHISQIMKSHQNALGLVDGKSPVPHKESKNSIPFNFIFLFDLYFSNGHKHQWTNVFLVI